MNKRIKAAREAAGLSQGQLARLLGCSRSLVTQWEAGQTAPTGWAERIAAVCGVSAHWLATGQPESRIDVGTMRGAARLSVEGLRRVQQLVDMLGRVDHA